MNTDLAVAEAVVRLGRVVAAVVLFAVVAREASPLRQVVRLGR